MTDLHVWLGLLFGWLLYAVFLTGTVSYFREEITAWMRPEIAVPDRPAPEAASLAFARLQQIGQGAARWLIDLPDERRPTVGLAVWRDPGRSPRFQRELLDPATGRPATVRATYGGDYLYYFHFDLRMPGRTGRYIVGLAAMAMLVAIVSGVIVHRRLFADFFTFRPGKGQRSWLDLHNATAVLALPYHGMITYTGLIPLMVLYLPWSVDLAYRGDLQTYMAETSQGLKPPAASGRPAALTDLAPLIAEAERIWGGERVGRIDVHRPGDAAARIELTADDTEHVSHGRGRLLFDGVTGALVASDAGISGAAATERALYGLHIARFADPAMRWLLFLSGLAGTAMVATGLLLWAVARRRKTAEPHIGHRLVDILNLGTIAGLPLAIAAFFWANRLIPAAQPGRQDQEVWAFLGVWTLAGLHAAVRPRRAGWVEQAAAGAVLFATLPLLDLATNPIGPIAGFDLTVLAAGLAFAATAIYLTRKAGPTRHSVRGRSPAS